MRFLEGSPCLDNLQKSRSANYRKASDEYPTVPAKYFERRCQIIHKRKQKHFYSLISPQNTFWRAN